VILIEDTIVSFDLLERRFCCDPGACLGACCVAGDSGAPLGEGEEREIRENYPAIQQRMKPAGIAAVERQGLAVTDIEGERVTPLIDGKECAYSIDEAGCCCCAIEKAWAGGESRFRKPLSCHLYPARATRYRHHEALNYDRWEVCAPARARGEREDIPVYLFLREALTRKYGEEWYDQLCHAAGALRSGELKAAPGE
jgi:hypothetical protein